jgi:hypothetical protein
MMIPAKLQLVLFVMLIVLIVGSPAVYRITDSLIGQPLSIPYIINGVPTPAGQLVHALVAGLLTWLYLMTFRI